MIKTDRRIFYHNAEWMLNHPRFGLLMISLIMVSFFNYAWLAALLLIIFSVEIALRTMVIKYKMQTQPYKGSTNRKLDFLFLAFDIIGALSLLITIFQFAIPIEDATLVRLFRAVYLLRALRLFRYIDLQSAIYSPTYGMVISLLVLLSFFATDLLLWVVLLFFFVELIVRWLIMKNMVFSSNRNKKIEWFFWWVDLVATFAMIPGLASSQFGSVLRALRLVRLFRPWLVIVRNLGRVVKEGQYLQEINLILLLLAVLSIAGGVGGHYFSSDFDFTRDGVITARDHEMLSHIWFAFRAFTDPGNVVFYPETNEMAIFSIFAVVVGVFIFAFFIGIGASIVSGLMSRLRNEKMNIANHMVMLGWNEASPFILRELRAISQRSFTRMKLVLLHQEQEAPVDFQKEDWVSYRWGDMENTDDLQRVNVGAARQVIVNVPDSSESESHAHSFFSLLAIREENPEVYISYATPVFVKPRLKSHKHPLQVGWDNQDYYDKPTVIHSQADVRANLFRQILHYRDFDQVISRLMVPPRADESVLNAVEWHGELIIEDGVSYLQNSDGTRKVKLDCLIKSLFGRGVILVAAASSDMQVQSVMGPKKSMQVSTLIGISLDSNTLFGEIEYVMGNMALFSSADVKPVITELMPLEMIRDIHIVVFGWIGAMPLMLKRLLQSYDHITVTVIDDLSGQECDEQQAYLKRRIQELPGAIERISFKLVSWDFTDMDSIRDYISGVDRIIVSRPLHIKKKPHAIVASVLSDLMSVLNEIDEHPMIFPVVDTREQALMLQRQMEKFSVDREVHLVVPNEFYGTYVAHTSYHMFVSQSKAVYEMHRALRYVINDLMSDDMGEREDLFSLDALRVDSPMPDSAQSLFNGLLEQGYLWIGYRLKGGVDFSGTDNSLLYKAFPREMDYRCLRQKSIVINPYCLPVAVKLWEESREDIEELIVIRFARSEVEDILF